MLDKYKDHTYRMLLMEAMAAKSFSKKKAEKLKTTFLGDTLEQKQLDDEPECESSGDEAVEEEERGEGGQEQENQENVENDQQTDSSQYQGAVEQNNIASFIDYSLVDINQSVERMEYAEDAREQALL